MARLPQALATMGRNKWRQAAGITCLVAVVLAAAHCDSGATGIEACRQIEDRRCEMALGCVETIQTEADVVACQLFYRDQCIYGMAESADPDQAQVEACLAALEKATKCKGAENLTSCGDPPAVATTVEVGKADACDIILRPENISDCAFLRLPEDDAGSGEGGTDDGAGGKGGAGGGTGGSGGAGG